MKYTWISLLSIPLFVGSFFMFAFSANSAPPANSLIKASGDAVYFLGTDEKRYVFPNEKIFKTWYKDFSSVIEITDQELATYSLGGNIFYRPGTRLIKITSDPKVYAVGPDGELYAIPDETTAKVLFGDNWSQRVDDLSDAFFSGYAIKSDLSSTEHPEGTVFQYQGESTYRTLMRDEFGTLRAHPITQEQLNAFGFPLDHVIQVPTTYTYSNGEQINTTETTFGIPSQRRSTSQEEPTQEVTPETAEINIQLANSLPQIQMALAGDSATEVFAFTITGDEETDVTLKQLTLSFYVDAGGSDPDFLLGIDQDDSVNWPAQQLLYSIRLADAETGSLLSPSYTIPTNGKVVLSSNILIEKNTSREIIVLGEPVVIPRDNTRISVDFHPVNDTIFTSNAKSLVITPTTTLNGAENPSHWVTPKDNGKLSIRTIGTSDSGLQPLDTEIHAYQLEFTSEGEPFSVTSLSLGLTPSGNTPFAVNALNIRYLNEAGSTITKGFTELTPENRFHFLLTDIYVPKNGKAVADFYLISEPFEENYSNKRLQFDFAVNDFMAKGLTTETSFTEGSFADTTRLQDLTGQGNLIILRNGNMSVTPHTSRPEGLINRQPSSHVFSFTLNSLRERNSIRKLTFELETSDVNRDGDDNDLLEKIADASLAETIALYTYNADNDNRTRIFPSQLSYAIKSKTTNEVDFTPQDRQTSNRDTGIFVFTFSGSGISINEGESLSYMLEFNTTLLTTEEESTIKFRLLGDKETTSVSEANFLWDDGSQVFSSGYLINGLDLSGSTLSIPK